MVQQTAPRPRVAVVMTVFNRREQTLRCLASLRDQERDTNADVTVFMVDDASTDGTSAAVAERFPEVRLVPGDGNLFWSGGTRQGLAAAYDEGKGFDFYWWVNDDTTLDRDALDRLLATAEQLDGNACWPGILTGTMRDPQDGSPTYGGRWRPQPRRRPLRFTLMEPGDLPARAETMNGNCVLVPAAVARTVGNISPAYRQRMGDFDYGLRATRAGHGVWVAPGTHGECAKNPPHTPGTASLAHEIRMLWSTKLLPFGAWGTFCRRWAGPLWPLFFLSPYVRDVLHLIGHRLRTGRAHD